jgi:hypothetical protein
MYAGKHTVDDDDDDDDAERWDAGLMLHRIGELVS